MHEMNQSMMINQTRRDQNTRMNSNSTINQQTQEFILTTEDEQFIQKMNVSISPQDMVGQSRNPDRYSNIFDHNYSSI